MIVRKRALEPIDFDGLRIFDYTADHDLGSSLAHIDVPPSGRHPKAWSRRSDKYYLVTDGQIRFNVDDVIVDCKAGDFCFVKQGSVFGYENVSGEPASVALFHTPAFDLDAEVFVD